MVANAKSGVSPVVGIILLTAVTVALVGLAAFFVFDVGDSRSSGVGSATVKADYESESRIDVQLLKQGSSEKVIVRSSLGTEYMLNETGDEVVLLNQDGNQTPVVLSEQDGERSVLRSIPPRSFTPDIVVSKQSGQGQYSTVQEALTNARDGDIIVVQRAVYYENVDVVKSNITLVGESGTVIADNGSDDSVVDIRAEGVQVSNIDVNANSSQIDTSASYGVSAEEAVSFSRSSIVGASVNGTKGVVKDTSDRLFVSVTELSDSSTLDSVTRIIPVSPSSEWTQSYNSDNGDDRVRDIAVDSDDNVIAVGREVSSSDKEDWRVVKYDSAGQLLWKDVYSSGNGGDAVYGVTVDSNDNVVAVGYKNIADDKDDWRIVKYSENGSQKWEQTYSSGNGYDRAVGVAVDMEDNIIVAGSKGSSNWRDWRVAKYDSNGSNEWVKTYSSGNGAERARSVGVGENNSIFVTGLKKSSTDKRNWRTVRYSPDGTRQWVETYSSGNGIDQPFSLAVDNQGDIVVVGEKSNSNNKDWFMIKYYSNSSIKWTQSYDSGSGDETLFTVATDGQDDIVIAGTRATTDGQGWRVAKYNQSGYEKWSERYTSGNGSDVPFGIDVGSGFVAVAGSKSNGTNANWRVEKIGE